MAVAKALEGVLKMREALFYSREGDKIRCSLCPHECLLSEGKVGLCRQRRHVHGRLMAEGYARVSSIAMDPIEKKPLYHFYPGSFILRWAGYGATSAVHSARTGTFPRGNNPPQSWLLKDWLNWQLSMIV